jgi:hypothetical protein
MATQEEIYQEPSYSINVLEFVRVAHEYCIFAESAEDRQMEQVIGFFLRLGPLLYVKGALLPEIEVENPDANERFVTEEEWEAVFNQFRSVLGREDEFLQIDYEQGIHAEPVRASLAENFADIYQDLKDFLLLYQKHSRDAKQNAVAECASLFRVRWGIKVLANLRYIHFCLYRVNGDEESIDL